MRAPARSAQRGVALIIVIWIATLLAVIAASFTQSMRSDVQIVGNSLQRAKLDAAAHAGVQRAILEFMKPLQVAGRWPTDGTVQNWEYQGAALAITITDESAKIDINIAPEALLRGLFQSQGATEEEALALVDAVMDWKDADTLKRQRGAEDADYETAGLKARPANAAFQSVEELRQVMGMTPALYERVAPLVTIHSRQPGLNSQIASREALRALPGVTEAQLDEFLARREAARVARLPIPVFASPYTNSFANFNATQIRVVATAGDGASFAREAIVQRLSTIPKRTYTYLRWQEGRLDEPVQNAASAPNPPSPSLPKA